MSFTSYHPSAPEDEDLPAVHVPSVKEFQDYTHYSIILSCRTIPHKMQKIRRTATCLNGLRPEIGPLHAGCYDVKLRSM